MLCADCERDFLPPPTGAAVARPRCLGCALTLPQATAQGLCGACLRQPMPWSRCATLVDYEYPWSALIARWKFGDEPMLARHFGRWMRENPGLRAARERADVVTPVPLADARLCARGFDQAALLAQFFCQDAPAGIFAPDVLLRQRHTATQSSLPKRQRLRNMRGAFAVSPSWSARLPGQRVLLVDDVLTTGSTLRAATAALLSAGAQSVEVACLARTQR